MSIKAEVICLGKPMIAKAERMGSDLNVMVMGGDEPHFGSVSLGIARKSLTGSGEVSATVSTMNMTGHKDDIVGNRFAERLASTFNCRAIVACGIHYDCAGPGELAEIQKAAEELLEKLVDLLDVKELEDEQW